MVFQPARVKSSINYFYYYLLSHISFINTLYNNLLILTNIQPAPTHAQLARAHRQTA